MVNANTTILNIPDLPPVRRAAAALKRDIRRLCLPTDAPGVNIRLVQQPMPAEAYTLEGGQEILLRAGDALGFVYGLYRISRELFGDARWEE